MRLCIFTNRKKSWIFLLILALLMPLASCTSLPLSGGQPVFLPAAGEDPAGAVETYLQSYADPEAGVAVTVFDGSRRICEKYAGYADRESQTAVTEDSVFDWGECASLLVWISAMQLAEQGKLNLNRDVRFYLPAHLLSNLPAEKTISMIHLMNHTAGCQEVVSGRYYALGKRIPALEKALTALQPEMVFPTGKVTAYSAWGTSLAAYVIECITGQTYDQYVETHIFMPLGMENTALLPDLSDNPSVKERRRKMICYSRSGRALGNAIASRPLYPADMCAGTMEDFATFAQALLPGGEAWQQLFSEKETLLTFLKATDTYADETPKNSHGLWHIFAGTALVGHEGESLGCTSSLMLDLAGGTGLCVMTNIKNDNLINRGLREMVYGSYTGSAFDRDKALPSGFFGNAENVWSGPLSILSAWTPPLVVTELTTGITGYWQTDQLADGRMLLEQPTADRIQIPDADMKERTILLGWLVLSVLGALRSLLRCLRPSRRRALPGGDSTGDLGSQLRMAQIAGDFLTVILAVSLIVMVQLLSQTEGAGGFRWTLIMDAVAGILLLLLTFLVPILYLRGRRQEELTPRGIPLLLRQLTWTGALANILYWQIYAFWRL